MWPFRARRKFTRSGVGPAGEGRTETAGSSEAACSCPGPHDRSWRRQIVAPSTSWSDEGPTPEPVTFGELVEMEAITVTPLTDEQDVHFMVWVGDEALLHYDDDAPLQLDDALAAQPGIEQVDWEDREVLMVTAPDLCDTALEAAVAAALADPRVRS